jgi:hypothetical protein
MVQVIKNLFDKLFDLAVKFGEFRAEYYVMKNTVHPVDITTTKE